MTIQAIETRYAGCRFRSRLEARWAVFFDRLGIPWEYEPEGVQVTWRLQFDDTTFPYLPDFWLPREGVWAEVKGSLTSIEGERLLNAAASLSSNNGGGCGYDNGGHDLILLGPIPRPSHSEYQVLPVQLHMHKGDLHGTPWLMGHPHDRNYVSIANDSGDVHFSGTELLDGLMEMVWGTEQQMLDIQDAFTVARSARFEHGEQP